MWLESQCGCWEFNLGSLQEQQAGFLTAEQSLQPSSLFFETMSLTGPGAHQLARLADP